MPGIKGQPGTKPQSVSKPVPGAEAQDELDQFLADSAQSAPQMDTLDQFLGSSGSVPPQGQDFQVQEPSSFMGVNTDISGQFRDMPVRVLSNLAQDPASVKLTLEKRLGADNVKQKGDTFYFRQPGEKAFRRLDPTTFEVVNDLFSDFYRESIQTMGGVAGAAEGAAAGALATGPLAPVGAAGGAFVGGALGVAGTSAALDAAAERFGGVVRAEDKGAMQRTGEYLTEGLMFATGEKLAAGLASKWAARRARVEGLRKLEEVAPVDRLTEAVKTNLETLRDMNNLGLTTKIAGTNLEVPAHQLLPFNPQVQKVAQSVSGEKAFQQAQNEAASNFGEAALNLVETAGDLTKGRLQQVVSRGVPLTNEVSAKQVNGLFNSVRRAEGEVLGEFRKMAKATAKKSPLPAPKTAEVMQDIFKQIGVRMKDGELVFPKDDDLIQIVGSKDLVAGFKGDLNRLNKKLIKGGFNIDELLNESNFMGAKNETARRVGGIYKSAIGRLSSAIRSDSREGMALVLEPEDALQYGEKMKRFRSISESMDQLSNYLRDDIGMNTFAKGLVNKGKEGLANLRSAKEFLLQEDPQMYRNLIGQYMEELALKHRDPSKVAGYNAEAMRKELSGLGSEYLEELFPARGAMNKDLVLRSFDLSNQLEKSIIKGSDREVLDQAKSMVSTLSWFNRGVNATYALMKFGQKDNRLLKLLSREGVESFLAATPKKERGQMREVLNGILTLARRNGTLAAVDGSEPASAVRRMQEREQPGQ